ncbi:unnamed protein product, partial [Didymodactylos carnosus]
TKMLMCLPSYDDYLELLHTVLNQPQKILINGWEQMNLNTCLKDVEKFGKDMQQDGLTRVCEMCGQQIFTVLTTMPTCTCLNQSADHSPVNETSKSIIPDQLSIPIVQGYGFYGTTKQNQLIGFESIFINDTAYSEKISDILSKVKEAFDEIDQYCEQNDWLIEINRFCVQWTPNQMKQMSESKQIFSIEEHCTMLRGWIDKTRTFELSYSTSTQLLKIDCSVISHQLCTKVETIYENFGTYLYRYTFTDSQSLIDKFQHAINIFDNIPASIETFANYASFLTIHKTQLSNYQETIEYLNSLFEILHLHYAKFYKDETIDKRLQECWKLFQLKLSEAADYVASETLIITERLRDAYEKYMNEAEILYETSTSGIYLEPDQDPVQMAKDLRKNCLEFMSVEKQLRQYSKWRELISGEPYDINVVEEWSTAIDLRKDLWKYLEITNSSIREWKDTPIHKFNVRRCQDKIDCWLKIAEDFKYKLPENDAVLEHWLTILNEFQQHLDMLKKLLSDAMTPEQWTLLFRANGQVYDPQQSYKLEDLLNLNILQQNQNIFLTIHKQATREQKLKDKLSYLQTWLNELQYRMARYRPSLRTTPVHRRLTSSYRQRLNRYRELRTRLSQTSSNTTPDIGGQSSQITEAYIVLNTEEILHLVEVIIYLISYTSNKSRIS